MIRILDVGSTPGQGSTIFTLEMTGQYHLARLEGLPLLSLTTRLGNRGRKETGGLSDRARWWIVCDGNS
jgi:hypothetical protein